MGDKYARDEFERRFLVSENAPIGETRQIVDRYIVGTRLRLRDFGGVLKLGKIEDIAPGHKKLTNIYLSEVEAELLRTLPAKELRKTRHTVFYNGKQWSIDVFATGPRIAEVEHEPGESIEIPDWCAEEITGDPAYSGWSLSQ